MLKKLIKKLLTDKILLGLVLVGILLFLVGAFCSQDDPKKGGEAIPLTQAQPGTQPAAGAPGLDPQLATQFVTWWLTNAMNYRAQDAKQTHSEAIRWMTKEARESFVMNYWTPEIENSILTGQVQAAFQPSSIQAEAINPDGSIVVGATGTLLIQSAAGTPIAQQVITDYLVRKDREGLRIAGLYNRQVQATAAAPAASPY